jgi:hypothetical protein
MIRFKFIPLLLAFLFVSLSASAETNTLTKVQKLNGWRLLFNGKDFDGWRTFNKGGKIGPAWEVKGGLLTKVETARSGGLMTVDTFGDFDLNWGWRIREGGNNGIKYFIKEGSEKSIGHEYQMFDDAAHGDSKRKGLTASFYDVLPPAARAKVKKPGEWNHSRIYVRGNKVEHWLNGKKVLAYTLGSEQVLKAVQDSKFKDVKGFGTKVRGHILLTDHKDHCEFKNIRIREYK